MTLTPDNIATIRREAIAFATKHPEHTTKHIVEAFEAAWFEDDSLTFEQALEASAVAERAIDDHRNTVSIEMTRSEIETMYSALALAKMTWDQHNHGEHDEYRRNLSRLLTKANDSLNTPTTEGK